MSSDNPKNLSGLWQSSQRALLSLFGFRVTVQRYLGEIELTAEETQKLGQIASGAAREYTFPLRIERMFQAYVRESSRAARISMVLMTAVVYLTLPLWISLLGLPAQSEALMTLVSLLFMAPVFAAVTYVQARYLASEFAEWLLMAAMMFEAVVVEVVAYRTEALGYFVEPSISVLVPAAVIVMARLRVSLNFLFVAIYFQLQASEPFWWGHSTSVDGYRILAANLVLLALLLSGAVWLKVPLRDKRNMRLRRTFNSMVVALYLFVLINEALLWPGIRSRGPTAWLMEILLLAIVMLSAIWSKLSSRRQWAANVMLQLMAYRDSLTGLLNRRAFEDHYNRVIRALGRSKKQQMVLALVDLDHFKMLNDDYGHDYGDGALAEMALVLTQFARRSMDISARLGGEEFALLLYDCDAANARRRLGELVRAVAEMKIENRSTGSGVLTCSVGAVVLGPGCPLGTAYRLADELLYQVKSAGRNNYALTESL